MSNVPEETGNQPAEFIDDPENDPGQQDEAPPEKQSDGQ
jgi:hypothetical protein